MAIDPICGMEVNEATAQWTSDHMGKTYYFCAPGCKKTFDENPSKFAGADTQPGQGHHGHQASDSP